MGLPCLHVTLSPLYGPYFLSLDSCSLRALEGPLRSCWPEAPSEQSWEGLTNGKLLEVGGGPHRSTNQLLK